MVAESYAAWLRKRRAKPEPEDTGRRVQGALDLPGHDSGRSMPPKRWLQHKADMQRGEY